MLALPAVAPASTYTVNSTGDGVDAEIGEGTGCETAKKGECTLRAAIEESNESMEAAKNTIRFSAEFNGEAADMIVLGKSLPGIEYPVHIDGDSGGQCSTKAGVPGPCVGVSGPAGSSALNVESSEGVEIEGLAVTGAKVGISVLESSELLPFIARDDWFGVTLDGKAGGNAIGLLVGPGAEAATIGGTKAAQRNVFANNTADGLDILGAEFSVVQGNYFGVKPDGSTPAANGKDIEVTDSTGGFTASETEIGATIKGEALSTAACDGGCNVIAGATSAGVDLQGDGAGKSEAPATGPTTVKGNYVGLSAAGTEAVGNGTSGIFAGAAGEVVVGGLEAANANRLAGGEYGVYSDEGAAFQANGNTIGVSAAGGMVAPPSKAGVFVSSLGVFEPATIYKNTIRMEGGVGIAQRFGGATIEKNVVKGALNGILASESSEAETFIEGNRIEGASANGILVESDLNQVLGNEVFGSGQAGIRVKQAGTLPTVSATTENLVGGNAPATENLISNSGGAAVEILDLEGTDNGVGRNRGSGNAGPFIDLVATQPGTEPIGPNGGIKPPAIAIAKPAEASGSAQAGATVRVFRKATASSGEIASFLGEAVANGSGNWVVAYAAIPGETQIAATQTGPKGGTSELAFAKTEAATGGGGGGSGGGGGGGGGGSDTKSPDTKLLKAPPARVKATTVKFKFSSNEAGSSFECKLDKKPFKPCRSPKQYKGLKPGKHVFKVRAIDPAGNVDLSPATKKFEVRR
jgi:hypothetical protein